MIQLCLICPLTVQVDRLFDKFPISPLIRALACSWYTSDKMAAFTQVEHRPLTTEEAMLLEWLIANGKPEARRFSSRLSQIRVVARCTCGCPTLDLALAGQTERTTGPSEILADFYGT